MGDALGPQDVSQLAVVCPLCHRVHERCEFRAGSVYCARPDCRNPHHREPRSMPPGEVHGRPGGLGLGDGG